MKFDISKALSTEIAGKAKVGRFGWFADDLDALQTEVEECAPEELAEADSDCGFRKCYSPFYWDFFYPMDGRRK